MKLDLAIVGAGVIGMATARAAAQAGLSVAVFERGEIGREASWAAGGILWPLRGWQYPPELTRAVLSAAQGYAEWAAALQRETGISPEYEQSGLVYLPHDVTTDDLSEARRWSALHEQPVRQLKPNELLTLAPGLVDHHHQRSDSPLYFPQVAQLRPPRLLAALRESLRQRAVPVFEQAAAQQIQIERGQVSGLRLSDRRQVRARQVLLAAGAWTPALLPASHPSQTIRPVRGQMLLYAPPASADALPLTRCLLQQGSRYLIPRRDGRILVGSTLEEAGFDAGVTDEAGRQLREFAESLLPALASRPIEAHWAGLRPGSPDGIPWVERVVGCEGLLVAAGHHRYGITLAPLTAMQLLSLVG